LAFIRRHPLATFFILAYAFSWGSFYLLGGPFVFPFGSVLAAFAVAGITEGFAGIKDIVWRCLRWRVRPIWYLAAFFVPLAIGLGALYLNVFCGGAPPAFAGTWLDALLILPIATWDAPLWEDSGWRGYALPRFPADRTRFLNTLILGILLAGWHLPIALSAGPVAVPYVITTVLSAFVTNWIYYNSGGSALLAILYHGSANAIGAAFFQAYTGADLLSLYWCLAATNLVAVALLLLFQRDLWFATKIGS
jgi:hypothetical protein